MLCYPFSPGHSALIDVNWPTFCVLFVFNTSERSPLVFERDSSLCSVHLKIFVAKIFDNIAVFLYPAPILFQVSFRKVLPNVTMTEVQFDVQRLR